MQIYRWHSELLRQYGQGDLIAVASSAREARDKLRAGFDAWAKEHRDYEWSEAHGAYGGEPDTEGLDKLRERFASDLAAEPTVHDTLWIEGSW